MLLMNSRRTLAIARWTLATAALAGIVLVYRTWVHVNVTTVALTLLLLVLVLAAEWGLRYAVTMAIAAAACYNVLFLPPLGTFTISDPQNWLALFAFLVTAIIASRLSQRARDEAGEARARQRELEILLRLSSELMQTDSVASLLSSIPSAVASVTSASTGALFLLEGDRLYQAGDAIISDTEFPHLHKLAQSLPGSQADGSQIQIPIRSGVRAKGLFILKGVSISTATADAIGGLIGVSIDRVQALESVARGEAAKESERLRTLMIDSVTHELRTPLTSIKAAATALLQGPVPEPESQELLSIIDEECDRLNQLVSEAVETAQLDAHQVQLHMATCRVSTLVDRALQACSWVQSRNPLHLEIPQDLEVRVDPGLIGKVICNLLENAGKYSTPETPITISADYIADEVALSVADRGEGIEPMEQSLIFERFYRGRSGQGVSGGTGMGLAISRAIVEAHGGRIHVTSQPGRGSVFTIQVPSA